MDRDYGGNENRQIALDLGFTPVVPPLKTRFEPWYYDRERYRRRKRTRALVPTHEMNVVYAGAVVKYSDEQPVGVADFFCWNKTILTLVRGTYVPLNGCIPTYCKPKAALMRRYENPRLALIQNC